MIGPYQQYIDGAWVDASSGGTWDLINPATEDVIGVLPFGGAADAQAAAAAAAAAFPAWSRKTPYERGDLLLRAAQWIRARIDDLARVTVEESGKPLREARGEWNTGANLLEYYAEEGKRVYGRVIPSRNAAKRIHTLYQPMGVIGVITAWNFPVAVPSWKILPALVAGNTIVFKPSEEAPATGAAFIRCFAEAGIPPGVINVVLGAREAGDALVGHPDVRVISFTGSTETGLKVYNRAAELGKKVALEMGGKNAIIVMDDANLELAAKAITWSAYGTTGQRCTATSRLIVHRAIKEQLIDLLCEKAAAIRVGDGLEEGVEVGPLINAKALEKVEHYVQIGREEGARVVFGAILGTGCGGGVVVDGRVIVGRNGVAGEWGHTPLPGEHHRQDCYCGRKGCIELYLSGPGLARDHRLEGHAPLEPEAIAARAAGGDADCEATLARYERRLARGLATVINLLDPEVIVLGGGLSNLDRLYEHVPGLWGEHVFSDLVCTRLVKHRHGDSSGVRGAAWLWS